MSVRRRAHTGTVGLLAAAVGLTAFAAPARAATEPPKPRHQATQQALDAIVAGGLPGATGQVRDRHGVWKGVSGVGNLKTGAPRGEDDRFRVASITKTFVATVLLQLEAEGRLDLDDKVEKHLPGLVRGQGHDGSRITVRQMLNHTSGIFDFYGDETYARKYMLAEGFLKNRYAYRSPESAIKVAMSHPPVFAPGTDYAYSNTNYVLAGLVIERVTGDSYENQVRKRIIKPLKLRATTVPGNDSSMPAPSSRGYSKLSFDPAATKIYDATLQNASQSWADGDIISSAGDLNRFYSALLRGKLLPKKQLKAMKTTTAHSEHASGGYGLGLDRVNTSCGVELWGHSGGWIGSLSNALTTADGRHSLAYNANGDWSVAGLEEVVEAEYCGVAPRGGAAGAQSFAPLHR
ncbi:serine hydrolase domain-containing protein [Streptomyces sp. NPDC020141]|uniref:serine hydrolase domain-containing protein n=1 Tax=Streptomyces sp. NPDC020141 TaxID=3365065 RepID=UPI0037A75A24